MRRKFVKEDDPSDSHSCTYKGVSDELQDSFLNVLSAPSGLIILPIET